MYFFLSVPMAPYRFHHSIKPPKKKYQTIIGHMWLEASQDQHKQQPLAQDTQMSPLKMYTNSLHGVPSLTPARWFIQGGFGKSWNKAEVPQKGQQKGRGKAENGDEEDAAPPGIPRDEHGVGLPVYITPWGTRFHTGVSCPTLANSGWMVRSPWPRSPRMRREMSFT